METYIQEILVASIFDFRSLPEVQIKLHINFINTSHQDMKPKPLPTQELLLTLLRYEPETGKLFWRKRPRELFDDEGSWKKWNTRYAGTSALNAEHSNGYRYGNINNRKFRAHRVIWKMMTGEEPLIIDHDNGIKHDNRWGNLKNGTKAANCQNQKRNSRNTSGIMGVRWDARQMKWHTRIGKKKNHIGYFPCLGAAIKARRTAEVELGYHPNHGRRS